MNFCNYGITNENTFTESDFESVTQILLPCRIKEFDENYLVRSRRILEERLDVRYYTKYITSFSFFKLSRFKNLQSVSSISIKLEDTKGLENCDNLKSISLTYADLSKLKCFDIFNLKELVLSYSKIDFSILNCPNLEALTYKYESLQSKNCIQLANLRSLILVDNGLTSFEGFNFPNLLVMDIRLNNIKNFEGFNCPKLQKLKCKLNNLISFKGLNCAELEYIDCSNNLIRDLEDLNCPKLKLLVCKNNQLKKFNYPNLEILE